MNLPVATRFARFSLAGGAGFLIEAVILTWLVQGVEMNVYVARAISFSIAVTATWAINRNFAFGGLQRQEKGREYGAYFVVQVIGALINLAVFVAVLEVYPGLREIIVVPLAAGSAVAMVFNFTAARMWVFRGDVTGRR